VSPISFINYIFSLDRTEKQQEIEAMEQLASEAVGAVGHEPGADGITVGKKKLAKIPNANYFSFLQKS
jgi:predicted RNA-binding protein with EMAP domain